MNFKRIFILFCIIIFHEQLIAQDFRTYNFNEFLRENVDVLILAVVGIAAIAAILISSRKTINKILLQTQLQIDSQAEQTRLQMEFQYKLNKKQIFTDVRKNELDELANDISNLINIFRQVREVNSLKWQNRDSQNLQLVDELTEVIKTYDNKKYECNFTITKLKLKIGKKDKNYDAFFGNIQIVYNMTFTTSFQNNSLTNDIDRLLDQIIITGENIITDKRKEMEKL